MVKNKSYKHLNAMLLKSEFNNEKFSSLIRENVPFISYSLAKDNNIEGEFYIKKATETKPLWSSLADSIVGKEIEELKNKSSSALLFIRVKNNVLVFPFGYGKSMLKTQYFVSDFGLKTALNSLEFDSLRSVNTYSLEEQPIQKKIQSAKDADANLFGIDIFKDILRSVTGSPRSGVRFKNIYGMEATYSFSCQLEINELPQVAKELLSTYRLNTYKSSFPWVDNIKKINDSQVINCLNEKLITAIRNKNKNILLNIPEILDWNEVTGFSFTRSKTTISPELDSEKYLYNINKDILSIESIKKDRLFVHFSNSTEECSYAIYKCIYFEIESTETNTTRILFAGIWYEIDRDYISRINSTLAKIELSDIPFPSVKLFQEDEKEKLENEEDYNKRAAEQLGFYLLDRKLIRTNTQASPVELCDLLSPNYQFIHVKHGKTASSGLSHLFAQGGVSATLVKKDREFRKEVRKKLKAFSSEAMDLVPLDGINQNTRYEVVFLILGKDHNTIKDNLPFFSKVNLTKAYEDLLQYGYTLKIAGAEKAQ